MHSIPLVILMSKSERYYVYYLTLLLVDSVPSFTHYALRVSQHIHKSRFWDVTVCHSQLAAFILPPLLIANSNVLLCQFSSGGICCVCVHRERWRFSCSSVPSSWWRTDEQVSQIFILRAFCCNKKNIEEETQKPVFFRLMVPFMTLKQNWLGWLLIIFISWLKCVCDRQ